MTILSSAPRQDEFMPILCIMAAYSQTIIEELLGLQMGEIELLLRGLHSVVAIYSGREMIKSHHASFLDFLNSASRSQKFHIGSLQNQMHLAQCFLDFAAGHYRETFDYPSRSQQYVRFFPRDVYLTYSERIVNLELIPLIISLPPSVELCPLIERMNPEQIFNLGLNLQSMLSWLNVRLPEFIGGTSDILSENTVGSPRLD
jgi:hypothetical protein